MMKKKYKKIILIIPLLIVSIFINQEKVYGSKGSNFGYKYSGKDAYDDGVDNTGFELSPPVMGDNRCDVVHCSTSHSYNGEGEVKVDIKLMDGTIINDNVFSSTFNTKFLAGTYVMMKVYETQSHTSSASYSVRAAREIWKCVHYQHQAGKPYCSGRVDAAGSCHGGWTTPTIKKRMKTTYEECECSVLYDSVDATFDEWKDVTGEYIGECSGFAVAQNVKLSPMYDAIYKDSNDIDAPLNTGTSITIEGQECNNGKPVDAEDGKTASNGTYSNSNKLNSNCSVTYDRNVPICMNVKTGKVRYLDGGGECDKTIEYEVTKDKDGYWKYFIPLNANSKDGFSFELVSSGHKKAKVVCENIIDNYPETYQYMITDNPSDTFIGKNLSKQAAKLAVANGCYFKTTVKLPIEQKFYNELENGKNFEGFNFYYKPIDINNPFPNGLTNTSIWYDWNNNPNKNPDLSKSYDKVTYIADVAENTSDIRNYKKNCGEKSCEYTSWYNMNVNGSSNFIQDKDYIIRKVQNKSYYPLGCGPWNEKQINSDGSKNVFYQPECGNS